jgi:signal transduction histidine kinase
MLHSVKNWLTLLVVALVAVASAVTWAYVVPPLRDRLEEGKLADMKANAAISSSTVSEFTRYNSLTGQLVVTDAELLMQLISRIGMRLNGHVIVFDSQQAVRADSGGSGPVASREYPQLARALKTAEVEQGVVVTDSGRFAVTAVPLFSEASRGPVGAVLVATSLVDVDRAVEAVQRQLLQATALALVASLVAGYLASLLIARRLKRIEHSAEAIAGGDLSTAVPVGLEDEIGQLAASFNTMAERLRDAFSQVARERDRIELLLNDLSEGVIGISADGRVTISNPAAAVLLGTRLAPGAELGSAFPYDVANIWYESRDAGNVQDVVFVHGDRTLEAVTYPVGSGADFTSIIVVRDVTAQARLDRARRDFIANASHEFKTPLFSLAGVLELLDEGELSDDEQREFMAVMRQQVDRLRTLAVSMLDLSRVEAESLQLQPELVDIATVARSVLDEFQPQAQAKRLDLGVEEGRASDVAWCDEDRLAQVLRALVDNAVKFSRDGSAIRITTNGDARSASLIVTDDGPGIAEDELPLIFDRFHRGRDERASTTGAGLGLSIARELVELMGGSLSAASKEGVGTTFTVRLPRNGPADRRSTGDAMRDMKKK